MQNSSAIGYHRVRERQREGERGRRKRGKEAERHLPTSFIARYTISCAVTNELALGPCKSHILFSMSILTESLFGKWSGAVACKEKYLHQRII